MGDIEAYPFSFMNKPPTSLQILASTKLALMLWRIKFTNSSYKNATKSLLFEVNYDYRDILVIEIPPGIETQMAEKIRAIRCELTKWLVFHSEQDLFGGDFKNVFSKYFKHIVTNAFGSISFKATAINMLNSSEFSDLQNYKIACAFCLEEQIKRFWPSVANDVRINVTYELDKLNLGYWNDRMKLGGNPIVDTELVKSRLKVSVSRIDDGRVFEYFFKLLPDRERVSEIISFLGDTGPITEYDEYNPAVVRLLSELNRAQAEEVFKQKAPTILAILAENDDYFQWSYRLWTQMAHTIVENDSRFSVVLYKLWDMVFMFGYRLNLSYSRCDEVNDLLLEIWSGASHEFKVRLSSYHIDTFFEGLFVGSRGFSGYYGHDMRFALDLLDKSQNVDKEQLWEKYWRGLALRSRPLYFEQLMKRCISNDDAVELYKNRLLDFKELFRALISHGFYSDLKDYLRVCSKDAGHFLQSANAVLETNICTISKHDDEKFAKFDWFVGELFSNVEKDVGECKVQIVSCANSLRWLLESGGFDRNPHSDYFGRIINRFATNEENFNLAKRKLLERCPTYLIGIEDVMKIDYANRWIQFLEWCTADAKEADISAVKQLFDADVIFVSCLNDYLGFRGQGFLNILDRFLSWYFANEEDAKNFKLDKIKNYQRIDILCVGLKSPSHFFRVFGDSDSREILLNWFFDNDLEKVYEFCESCDLISPKPQWKLIWR